MESGRNSMMSDRKVMSKYEHIDIKAMKKLLYDTSIEGDQDGKLSYLQLQNHMR